MGVFKPDQVLARPVSSYYQGKAIRAGLKKEEQMAELRQQEIDDAPSKRDAAKQAAMLQAENIRSQIDKRVRDGEIAELELSAKALTPVLTDYSNEKDEDTALENFNKNIGTAIQSLSKKEQQKVIDAMGPDKQFSHEEVHAIGLGVRMFTDDKEKSDYTLGQGRFSGETNELIAGVAPSKGGAGAAPKTHINYEMPDGSVVAARPDSAEADRIVAAGGVVAGTKSLSAGKLTDRDKKIRDYQGKLGLSEDFAIKLADGIYSVKPNSVTGEVQVIDEVGQVVREVDVERPNIPTPKPEKGKTLWDHAIYATGPANTVSAAISIPLSWVGASPAEKVVEARQVFATTNQDFIRALQNNKRYPIAERMAITEEISMVPAFFDDPKIMRLKMQGLRSSLTLRMEQAKADAADTGNTPAFRGGAKTAAQDIENYLAILGEPSAPEAAIEKLRQNPELAPDFEKKYGYLPEDF